MELPLVAVVAAVLVGLVLLTVGGDTLVNGATRVSRRFGMSAATVGATVVATATSAPELAVSTGAVLHGDHGLALGNVVGSNIANVLLVLGAAALVSPIRIPARVRRVDIPVCAAATALLLALSLDGRLGPLDGAVLLLVFAATIGRAVHATRSGSGASVPVGSESEGDAEAPVPATSLVSSGDGAITDTLARVDGADAGAPGAGDEAERGESRPSAWPGVLLVLVGTAILVGGAELLVLGAEQIALGLGVSDLVVGLTVVAIGTSLPELAAAISAGRAGTADLAVGNAVGSNVANIGLVLGLPVILVAAIPVPATTTRQDLPLALLVLMVVWVLARWRGGLDRLAGILLLGGYAAYLASLVVSAVP